MTTKVDEIRQGDWVRFMLGGRLVIGEVAYLKEVWPETEVVTDAGSTIRAHILEIRHVKG